MVKGTSQRIQFLVGSYQGSLWFTRYTGGYHPQNDGLVEKFNSMLISMISKWCSEIRKHDWDDYLSQLLFAYQSSSTETVLCQPLSSYKVDLDDYHEDMVSRMSLAWSIAQERIKKAQLSLKTHCDRCATDVKLQVGDRVMVYQPG